MKALKSFQREAVESASRLFSHAQSLYDEAQTPEETARVASYHGALLLEAPTGAGKTLVAGTVASERSTQDRVVWLWFAPFAGLVKQSEATIRDGFPGLRVRDLNGDRRVEGTLSGDVFVATWASVATDNKDNRKVLKPSETQLALAQWIEALRQSGFRIGVVVDEAHHGFGSGTKALELFRDTLRPEYSLFVTATPDDADAEKFRKATRIAHLSRISVSREDAWKQGLVKRGLKSVAFVADNAFKTLVDFEAVAFKGAVETHNRIKSTLAENKIELTPLLLVQVDSDAGIARAKSTLAALGMPESAIAVHTAKEPDKDLLDLAHNPDIEVLIFKMAVALGFDAPRAWTLISMRGSRDPDFGTQIVGRILRVHSRIQPLELQNNLNELETLQYGYVFLADVESQTGLKQAGERVNALKTQFASVAPFTMLVKIGDEQRLQVVSEGQSSFDDFWKSGEVPNLSFGDGKIIIEDDEQTGDESTQLTLADIMTGTKTAVKREVDTTLISMPKVPSGEKYARREDVPTRLWTQKFPDSFDDLLQSVAARIRFDDAILNDARRKTVELIRNEQSIFDDGEERSKVRGALDMARVDAASQKILFDQEILNSRELSDALLLRLKREFEARGDTDWSDDEEMLERALSVILATHKNLLADAQKQALAQFTQIIEAEPLPDALYSVERLDASRRNIYGITPAGLNRWERAFVRMLDDDTDGIVRWWHRNPPRRPESVRIILPNGEGFYPDFVVSVSGRKTEHSAILIDTKAQINDPKAILEAAAEHPSYGRVMMPYWKEERDWITVRFDPVHGKNILDQYFRIDIMPTF